MNKIKSISLIGLFTAITIVLANTIGFIQIGPIAITIMHLPVIIGAIMYGKGFGAVMGLIFGLISLIRSYLQGGPTAFIMMNPLISVLPRLVFGLLAGLIYEKISKINRNSLKIILLVLSILSLGLTIFSAINIDRSKAYRAFIYLAIAINIILVIYGLRSKEKEDLASPITSLLSTACHSLLVLGSIYIIYADKYIEILDKGIEAIILGTLINVVFEMLVSAITVPPVIKALKKGV